MKLRGLLIGLAVLVVLVGLALLKTRQPARLPTEGVETGTLVLPFDINAVERLDVASGGATTTVARKEGRWVAVGLWDYPADFNKISERLRQVAGLRVGQVIRGGERHLGEFGLEETSGEGVAPATRLDFYDGQDNRLGILRVGQNRTTGSPEGSGGRPGGTYVRFEDGPVVLVDDYLGSFPKTPRDWVDSALLRVSPADVVKVTVGAGETPAYTLLRAGADGFRVEGSDKDEDVQRPVADRLMRALQYLTFSALADPSKPDEELGFDRPQVFRAETREGMQYAVSLGNEAEGGQRYVRLAVDFQPPEPPEKPEATGAGEEGEGAPKAAEDDYARKRKEHEETVQRLTGKLEEERRHLQGWTYVIPQSSADNMVVRRDELLKKKDPAQDGPGEEGTETP